MNADAVPQYPFIASRIIGTPLLVAPDKLRAILQGLGPRIGFALGQDQTIRPEARELTDRERRNGGYEVTKGLARLELHDTLVARGGWAGALSGVSSYVTLQNTFAQIADDDEVARLLIEFSSFGGEAELCGETAAALAELNAIKPVTAMVHDFAASAAYWLASQAGEIVITRTGEAGSIGVVMTHVDQSKMNEELGLVVTHIHAGAHKVDLSPHAALGEEAQKLLQVRIDDLMQVFAEGVAAGRNLSVDQVKATQARMFGAEEALQRGLVDRVDSFANVVQSLQPSSAAAKSTRGNAAMEITTVAQLREQYPGLCAELVDTATTAGADAERERVESILDLDETEGREAAAMSLATTPGLTAERAKKTLSKMPQTIVGHLDTTADGDGTTGKVKRKADRDADDDEQRSAFERYMSQQNPKLLADSDRGGDADNPEKVSRAAAKKEWQGAAEELYGADSVAASVAASRKLQ